MTFLSERGTAKCSVRPDRWSRPPRGHAEAIRLCADKPQSGLYSSHANTQEAGAYRGTPCAQYSLRLSVARGSPDGRHRLRQMLGAPTLLLLNEHVFLRRVKNIKAQLSQKREQCIQMSATRMSTVKGKDSHTHRAVQCGLWDEWLHGCYIF